MESNIDSVELLRQETFSTPNEIQSQEVMAPLPDNAIDAATGESQGKITKYLS